MNVLIILGHPRHDSFCGALARAYRDGASGAGVDVRELVVTELEFDPDVHARCPTDQELEADLEEAQRQIRWADHLVLVYPNWWGTMPALLKGFFDRAFTPGFAFSERDEDEGGGHEGLLNGKTAELIVTMDMPSWVYRFVYRQPGNDAVKRCTLGYAGIRTTRVTNIGPVTDSTPERRDRWLEKVAGFGRRLPSRRESRSARAKRRLVAGLKALRLQFYPMSWIAYTIGALAAAGSSGIFSRTVYWVGFAFLFFLEAATVMSNEYFDYATDRINAFAGPFTGGSRVLVDDELSVSELRAGIGIALVLAAAFGATVVTTGSGSPPITATAVVILAALALGYTIPPLQLSYRSLGELTVAATHSIAAMLCGFLFLGGSWRDPVPWLVSVPLFLATVPSITLAGIPDAEADLAAGKRTIAVRFGIDRAVTIAQIATLLAALVGVIWQLAGVVPEAYDPLIYLSVPHAAAIVWLLQDRLSGRTEPVRIDGLLIASLSYVLWFGVAPLLALA